MTRSFGLLVILCGLAGCWPPCGGASVPSTCNSEAPPVLGTYEVSQECSDLDLCLDGAEVELTETELVLRYTDEDGNVFVGTYPRDLPES